MPDPKTFRLLTPADVADTLATDEGKVRRLIKDGALPAIVLPGGEFRVSPQSLETYLSGAESNKSMGLKTPEAAAYLGIAVQTLYNNRASIPSMPGFRTLLFDPKVLEQVRKNINFRSPRRGRRGSTEIEP